jgi:hypothetical protein
MDETRIVMIIGATALCAIVGIYYVGVRRRVQANAAANAVSLPEIPPQPVIK